MRDDNAETKNKKRKKQKEEFNGEFSFTLKLLFLFQTSFNLKVDFKDEICFLAGSPLGFYECLQRNCEWIYPLMEVTSTLK